MKTKKPTDKSGGKIIHDHLRQLHILVNSIMSYAEDPANWPLTQQEQIAFIRTVIFNARKIRKSEGFITAALILACDDLKHKK